MCICVWGAEKESLVHIYNGVMFIRDCVDSIFILYQSIPDLYPMKIQLFPPLSLLGFRR